VLTIARDKYSKINKVVTWGNSLGGLTSQALAEQYSGAVDGRHFLCVLQISAQAEITMAGDFLWGMKTLFNPAIKGTGYSAGQAGYVEMLTDLGTVLTTFKELSGLSAASLVNPTAPAVWPTTTPASYQS
jgi:pimeloyl-ACP methyl ester carboxylesterase